MNRFSFAMFLAAQVIASCGSVAAASSAPLNERQLEGDNPLLDNWEKEEGLANLLNEKIESSKTASPTEIPTQSPTNEPSNVSSTPSLIHYSNVIEYIELALRSCFVQLTLFSLTVNP